MKLGKDLLQIKFQGWMKQLKDVTISPIRLEDYIQYQQSVIKQYYNPQSSSCFICQKQNKYSVSQGFANAFKYLQIQEQIDFYSSMAQFVMQCVDAATEQIANYIDKIDKDNEDQVMSFQGEYKSDTIFKSWNKCDIMLLHQKSILLIKTKTEKQYQLSQYLVHRQEQKKIIQLVACNQSLSNLKIRIKDWEERFNVYQKIKFMNIKASLNKLFQIIQQSRKFKINNCFKQQKSRRMHKSPSHMSSISSIRKKQLGSPYITNSFAQSPFMLKLYTGQGQQKQMIQQLNESLSRASKNQVLTQSILKTLNMLDDSYDAIKQQITNNIISQYQSQITNINSTFDYEKIIEFRNCFLLKNKHQQQTYKFIYEFSSSLEKVVTCFLDIQRITKWNKWIKNVSIKARISSQNSLIIQEQLTPTSKFIRGRQFVYSRHVFKANGAYYFINTIVEHNECPLSMMLIRTGFQYAIWKLEKKQVGCKKDPPSLTNIKNYFQGCFCLEQYLLTQSLNNTQVYVDLDWEIKLNLNEDIQQSQFHTIKDQSKEQQDKESFQSMLSNEFHQQEQQQDYESVKKSN